VARGGEGREWRCPWCGRCHGRCRSTFRTGHARNTMSLMAVQKPSRRPPVRMQKRQPRH
jgi:heterodisulfide reductase subunit C